MNDCIYTSDCMWRQCDLACPKHAEISYWMERCGVTMDSPVLKMDSQILESAVKFVEDNTGHIKTYITKDSTVIQAELLSYCAICLHGRGTQFSHGIYNLNFAEYLDELRQTWQTKYDSEKLQYMKIWSQSATYLIISHLDYVRFSDFECQTLLMLLQNREKPEKSTFIVTPPLSELVGNGSFFPRLTRKLEEASK